MPFARPRETVGKLSATSSASERNRSNLSDGRLTTDNAAAEQAVRPLRGVRRNWLHLGGDRSLRPTAVRASPR